MNSPVAAISQAVACAFLLGLQLVFQGQMDYNTAFKQSHHFAAVLGRVRFPWA